MAKSNFIVAAGGLLYRDDRRDPEYAIVRTVKNGTWGLPKGKAKATDESLLHTALREVQEETGCLISPIAFAGDYRYAVEGGIKVVMIWHMEVVRERWRKVHTDIEQVRWVKCAKALELFGRVEERDFLCSALREDHHSRADTEEVVAAPSLKLTRFSPFPEWKITDVWSR
jgi:8-oxo-dGTP diphosphatase